VDKNHPEALAHKLSQAIIMFSDFSEEELENIESLIKQHNLPYNVESFILDVRKFQIAAKAAKDDLFAYFKRSEQDLEKIKEEKASKEEWLKG